MKAFAVRLGVDTPISLRNLLHLDALMGSIAVRLGRSHEDLPLGRSDGLWHASAALIETTAFGVSEATYRRSAALRRDSIAPGLLVLQLFFTAISDSLLRARFPGRR